MRAEALKPYIIKRASIMSAMIVLAVGIYLTASYFRDSLAEQLGRVNAATRATNTEIQALEEKVALANASLDLYRQLEKSKSSNIKGLDRQALADIVEPLKERYHLTGLSLKVAPVVTLTDEKFAKGTLQAEHTLVTLSFEGITDELLFSFIDLMLRQAAGYTQVDYLRMSREENLTKEYMLKLAKEEFTPLVKGEMAFHWIALKDAPKPKEGEAAGAPQ